MKAALRRLLDWPRPPRAAREERERDEAGLPAADPGIERALPALMQWLCRAQDLSASNDGGVARDFSLISGWATSYPETTGYIVPTMLAYARRTEDVGYRRRALRMADWLVSIQLPSGGFQGGKMGMTPVSPVVFNTGQILLGLAAAQAETGAYLSSLRRAADWLVSVQDDDGCWRRHASPFAAPGDKQYDTHVAWGLFEAERVDPGRGWGDAGLRNVRWVIGEMRPNGWLHQCCLHDKQHPLTHTLGYALRGIVEAHRLRPAPDLLEAALRLASGLRQALGPDGHLPGRLSADWSAAQPWACLTGTVQVAHCWWLLYRETGEAAFADAARRANAYVRRTIALDGPADQRGGVKGSFPVDGAYGPYQYPNWAAKFAADSFMLEADIDAESAAANAA
jgi:hypothetical protein